MRLFIFILLIAQAALSQDLREFGRITDSPFNSNSFENFRLPEIRLRPRRDNNNPRNLLSINLQTTNRHNEGQAPDPRYNHENIYLYNECSYNAKLAIAKKMLVGFSEEAIQQFVMSTFNVSQNEDQDIEEMNTSLCNMIGYIKNGYQGLEREPFLSQLVSTVGETTDQLLLRQLTPEMLAQIKSEAIDCQNKKQSHHEDAYNASLIIYKGETPEGYTVLDSISDSMILEDGSGFFGKILIENPPYEGDKPKIMFVTQGSQDDRDWENNIKNAGVEQFDRVIDRLEEKLAPYFENGNEITFSGHSLGGGLSQAFSYHFYRKYKQREDSGDIPPVKIETITTGAYGASAMLKTIHEKRYGDEYDYENRPYRNTMFALNQTHYRIQGDPVSSLFAFPYGQRRTLYQRSDGRARHTFNRIGDNHLPGEYESWHEDNQLMTSVPDQRQDDVTFAENIATSWFASNIEEQPEPFVGV